MAPLWCFFFLWDWELLLRWNLSLCQTLSNWCMQKNDQKLKMWDHDLQLELAMIRPRVRRLHNFEWKTCFSCLAFKYLNNDSDDGSHFSFTVMVRVSQWSTLDFDWWIFINFFFQNYFFEIFLLKTFLSSLNIVQCLQVGNINWEEINISSLLSLSISSKNKIVKFQFNRKKLLDFTRHLQMVSLALFQFSPINKIESDREQLADLMRSLGRNITHFTSYFFSSEKNQFHEDHYQLRCDFNTFLRSPNETFKLKEIGEFPLLLIKWSLSRITYPWY